MLIKLKCDAGWRYLDNVEEYRSFGNLVRDPETTSIDGSLFQTYRQIVEAVARCWGDADSREFDRELWPEWVDPIEPEPPGSGRLVQVGVASFRGSSRPNALVVIADEAFLLSDQGDTIDRLR